MSGGGPLLVMRGMVKSFPGVQALRGVDLTLAKGEVLALLGENGAGKSTLMRILGGAQVADGGGGEVGGRAVDLGTPQASREAGVAVIYQEFHLVPGLNAVENLFLGREVTRAGWLSRRSEREEAAALFARLGAALDLEVPCRELSTAQQQLVEIAKALALQARVLVMDEPSAALTNHEVEHLFGIVRELRAQGIGIIYISHRLEEIARLADRVMILRDGAKVGEWPAAEMSRREMIERMVGRDMVDEFPPRATVPGEVRLEVRDLRRGRAVRGVSFAIRRGEILGLAGLVGAGRTETARLLFGADEREGGEIWLDGKRLEIDSPGAAIACGLGLLPEDRKVQGLVLQHSVRENFGLPNLSWLAPRGWVRRGEERRAFGQYVEQLRIRVPHQEVRAWHLSGGNQQKVVLAKWLARRCEVLIFDEPTRGIDAGAKYEIYGLMNELAAQGKAILMISSELPEVLGMSDRVLVMQQGRVTGEIADARRASPEELMQLAFS